jgi:diguanylate cyclase
MHADPPIVLPSFRPCKFASRVDGSVIPALETRVSLARRAMARYCRVLIECLLGSVLLLSSGLSVAQDLTLSDMPRITANAAVQYLEDPQGRLTVEQLRNKTSGWQQNNSGAFNQGYSNSVWWLHLTVSNPYDRETKRYLELSYAVLDYIDVYVYSGAEQLNSYQLGDLYPYQDRLLDNRFFVVPLQWQPGQTLDIYYRIKTSTAVQAPLTLWQPDAFVSFESNSNIAQGLYYGAMVVIAIYNLLIFLMLLERSYLFYVGFVMSLPMFLAAVSGQGFRYLWPEAVSWNDHAIPFFLANAFMFSALFSRRFLRVGKWSLWANKALLGAAIAAGACGALAFVMPYFVAIHLLVPLGLLTVILEMVVGVMAAMRRVPNATYYLIAWSSFLAGALMFALNKLGVLPANFLTEYSMQIGSLLEAVLLSFAMAERINVERKLRFEAQSETLTITRRLNEELEQRVQERTLELEEANRKLEELSNTDQLTGLKNRRYMEQKLLEEWTRCQRYGHSLSIVMLDIDFFKAVNDTYGHQAGDLCLQQVAQRILTTRWPSDKVARYGGEEFCLVLPETNLEGVTAVAERIRAAVEAEPVLTDKESLRVTVSLGTYTAVPGEHNTLELMMHRADMALYASKERGRNRVTPFTQADVHNLKPLPLRKRT